MDGNKEYALLGNGITDDDSDTTMAFDVECESFRGRDSFRTRQIPWVYVYIFISHICFVILLFGLAGYTRMGGVKIRHLPRQPSSLAAEVIEYQLKSDNAADHDKHSKFSGPPSEESENAWATILEPSFFAASVSEMEAAGESLERATQLADSEGGGFLTTFGVYHELHCLRQLRMLLYRDKYYHDLTDLQEKYLHGHLDHCIDALRISIMCAADTSLYTFYWPSDDAHRPKSKTNSTRYCVNWEALEEWSRDRAVPLSPMLKRPESGDENLRL